MWFLQADQVPAIHWVQATGLSRTTLDVLARVFHLAETDMSGAVNLSPVPTVETYDQYIWFNTRVHGIGMQILLHLLAP